MKAETGPCSMRSALNVASPARFLSNQRKEDLYTAGTATNQNRDSKITRRVFGFLLLIFRIFLIF